MPIFTLPFDDLNSETQLGICLRLNSDFNERSQRDSQKECYQQIISDFSKAIELLPTFSKVVTTPSKVAGYGVLSRLFLSLSDYEMSLKYSDSCLSLTQELTDFNTLAPDAIRITSSTSPYLREDLFHTTMSTNNFSNRGSAVDSLLLFMYDSNDLRKTFYFTEALSLIPGSKWFKGSFEFHMFGNDFTGITTSEVLLNRAECKIRKGDVNGGMDDINTLLEKRYKTGTFVPLAATSTADGLDIVLKERRKELCFRGIRWLDLRRLNKEPSTALTLIRVLDDITYILPPNDLRYALTIPESEIQLSGIKQNPR